MASAQSANSNATAMDFQQSAAAFNETRAEITKLVLGQQKTLRSMHVVLGVFSLILGSVMVTRILYDSWRAHKLSVVLRPRKLDWLRSIHTAEVFPLALAGSLIIQMIIIIGVQSANLNTFFEHSCRGVVQVVLPTIFLVAYANLVFGIEATIRALKGSIPRGKWTTVTCLVAIAGCLLVTWIPTIVWVGPNRCFGELIWIPFRYRRVIVPLLSVLLFAYIVLASLLTLKLRYYPNFDPEERIAASRMVYYLLFAIVEHSLIFPFFIQAYLGDFDPKFTSARIAEITLFSSGIFIAFLHLFLRVNVNRMIIKPKGMPWKSKKRLRFFGFFGPSDLEMSISGPLGVKDRGYAMQDYYSRPEKGGFVEYGYGSPEKQMADDNLYTPQRPTQTALRQSTQSAAWPLPLEPINRSGSKHSRKGSADRRPPSAKSTYSLFPNQAPADDVPRLPATVYSPAQPSNNRESRKVSFDIGRRGTQASLAPSVTDVSEAYRGLLPPMPLFASRQRHRRDSSVDSSATVQIGLRLSVAPAAMIAGNAGSAGSRSTLTRSFAPPPPTRETTESSGESLGLPIQAPAPAPLFAGRDHTRNKSSSGPSGPSGPPPSVRAPTPQTVQTNTALAVPAAPASPASTRFQEDDESDDDSSLYSGQQSFNSFTIINPQNSQRYLEAARNKMLPPTPPEEGAKSGDAAKDANTGDSSGDKSDANPVGSPGRSSPLRMNPVSPPERTASPRWVDLRTGTMKRTDSPARKPEDTSASAVPQEWI